MTKNLNHRKIELIKRITDLSSEQDVNKLEVFVASLDMMSDNSDIFKPMQEDISLEELKKEQNFEGINREEFDALAKELDIKETFEELLESI